jgi:predicted porin
MIMKRGAPMKARKIATLAALPAAILVANNALASAEVYGKVNITLNKYDSDADLRSLTVAPFKGDTQDNWELESNASRLGFKGDEDLGESGLKAVYKLEYETQVDDGSTEFKQRNIYGGVQGAFGTVIGGKFDTPLKTSQKKVDLFNDLPLGDIKNVVVGENRVSNIIQYASPNLSGFRVNLAFMPGEDSGTASGDNDGIADYTSISVSYENDMVYAALAKDSDVDNQDIVRAVGEIEMGNFTLGVLAQKAKEANKTGSGMKNFKVDDMLDDYAGDVALYGDTNGDTVSDTISDLIVGEGMLIDGTTTGTFRATDQTGYILSGKLKVSGNGAVKLQYGHSTTEHNITATDDIDIDSISIGYDHKLNKKTKVFVYATNWSAELGRLEFNEDTMALGFEHKF